MKFPLALLCSTALALSACSNNPDVVSDAGNGDAGDAGNGDAGNSDAGSDAGEACAPAGTFGGGEQAIVANSASALLVDETGAAVPGQPLYICGLDICSAPAASTDAGVASISTNLTEKKPAFKFGDAINYAAFAIPLDAGTTDFTHLGTGKLATAKLEGKPGAALVAGTAAVSGDVTVLLAANAVVGIDTLVYATADQQKLRAVNIPLTNLGPIVGGISVDAGVPASFALVYGVAPADTTLCPPAKVTVALPAALGWAANAGVEFWITTIDSGQTFAPYGGWTKISDGTVSADGQTASTTATGGFNVLQNFAIRLK